MKRASLTSYAGTNTASTVVNEVKYTYGGRGNVIKSEQAHGGAVTDGTRAIRYTYEDNGSGGTNAPYLRLTKVTYPAGRQVFYNYGDTDTNSYFLDRPENIASGTSGTVYVQPFYVGVNRLATTVQHPGAAAGGLKLSYLDTAGLDRFGRVTHQVWGNDSLSGTVYDDLTYTYDRQRQGPDRPDERDAGSDDRGVMGEVAGSQRRRRSYEAAALSLRRPTPSYWLTSPPPPRPLRARSVPLTATSSVESR